MAGGSLDKLLSRTAYFLMLGYYGYHWFLIIGGVSALAGIAAASFQYFNPSYAMWPAALFGVPGILWWFARSAREAQSVNPGLEILNEEAFYHPNDGGLSTFSKSVRVRARYHGVEVYRVKFKWTGLGPVDVSTSNASHTATFLQLEDGFWDMAELRFPSLRKGEEVTLNLQIGLTRPTSKPKPYFARNCDELYKGGLTLRVVLPVDTKVHTVSREIFLSERALTPVERHVEKHDSNISHEIRWPIPRPRIGCKYKLSWTV